MNKLQEACIISHEHWLKELEQTIATLDIDIPEIKIPEKTKEKIVSIKDAKSKSKKNRNIKSKVIKILIIAAIIASLLVSAVAFTPFREFVVEFFDEYNSFSNDNYEIHYPNEIEITKLPEGFVLIYEDVNKRIIVQQYQYNEKTFTISKNTSDTYYQISNVYSDKIEFYNSNIKYTLVTKVNGYNCTEVIWLTNEYSYVLTGYNMTNEELTELAKNIK